MHPVYTNLRINDRVEIISGKDKGRFGKILRFEKNNNRVVVERINLIKKHKKSTAPAQSGQILEEEAGIHISNVMFVCPECTAAVKIGKKFLEDGVKVRICKKCKIIIESVEK